MKQFEAKYVAALELQRRHHELRRNEPEMNHIAIKDCGCAISEAYRVLYFSLTPEQLVTCREAFSA
jgi:hypothetical protein